MIDGFSSAKACSCFCVRLLFSSCISLIKDIDITAGDFFYQGTADNARLTIVYDKKTGRLKGASEISQTAVDDINNLIPVMSLDVQPDDWKKKMLMAFPGLAYKIRNLV